MDYYTDFRKNTIINLVKGGLHGIFYLIIIICELIVFLAIIGSILSNEFNFFTSILMLLTMGVISLFFLLLLPHKKSLFQMQIILKNNNIYIQNMTSPWRIIWERFEKGEMKYFFNFNNKNIFFIDKYGNIHSFHIHDRSRYNQKELQALEKKLEKIGLEKISKERLKNLYQNGEVIIESLPMRYRKKPNIDS